MRVFNQVAAISAFAAGLAFSSAAIAVERDVSVLWIEVEDWLFVPTLADGSVESFVALRIEPGVGDNITTVWYLRLADSWESWAWEEQDQSRAIASIKMMLELPDSTDARWPIWPNEDPTDDPERFESGVLETDPFAETVSEMDDPTPLVEVLEEGGWRAATMPIAGGQVYDCDKASVLDGWSGAVEWGETDAAQQGGMTATIQEQFELQAANPCDSPAPEPECEISVCCYPIDFTLDSARHCFSKCTTTDPDGVTTETSCWGGPTGLFWDLWPEDAPGAEEPECNGWNIFDGAWGPVATYCGPLEVGHPDYNRDGTSCNELSGGCTECGCISDTVECIQGCCLRYELIPELYGYNSNSTAYNSLILCNVATDPELQFIELPDGSPLFGEPGWGKELPDNCDCP